MEKIIDTSGTHARIDPEEVAEKLGASPDSGSSPCYCKCTYCFGSGSIRGGMNMSRLKCPVCHGMKKVKIVSDNDQS